MLFAIYPCNSLVLLTSVNTTKPNSVFYFLPLEGLTDINSKIPPCCCGDQSPVVLSSYQSWNQVVSGCWRGRLTSSQLS